ncbi:MAG: hypothetical protein ACOZCO_05280 [Bacteroidota bacterium]
MKQFFFTLSLIIFFSGKGITQPKKYDYVSKENKSFEKILVDQKENAMRGLRYSPIAVYKNDVHALYGDDNGIYYSFSNDNGKTWKKETIIKQDSINWTGKISYAPFTACVETDCEGTVHLFLIESYFHASLNKPSKLLHYSRERGKTKWKMEAVDSNENGPMIGMDIDAYIDKDNNIHLAYSMAEKFTRYAFYDGKSWSFSDITHGTRPLGCAVVSDIEGNVYVAIGCFNEGVSLATKYKHKGTWDIERVISTSNWPCDIALGKDNSVHIVYIPSINDYNNPIGYACKRNERFTLLEFGESVHSDIGEFYNGNNMLARIKTDPSGRIHIVSYAHYKDKTNNRELIYLYSDDDGKTWKEQWLADDVTSYIESGFPDVDWNENYVFLSYKTDPERPALLRAKYDLGEKYSLGICRDREPEYQDSLAAEARDSLLKKENEKTVTHPAENSDPGDFSARKLTNQGNFYSKDPVFTLEVNDAWNVDSDTISIKYGDDWIIKKMPLESVVKLFELKTEPGITKKLLIYADSEGKRPPCTVAFTLRDSHQVRKFVLNSNLEKNGFLNIIGY